MASSKLHIDLGECIAYAIAFINKSVVYTDNKENYRGDDAEENQE